MGGTGQVGLALFIAFLFPWADVRESWDLLLKDHPCGDVLTCIERTGLSIRHPKAKFSVQGTFTCPRET